MRDKIRDRVEVVLTMMLVVIVFLLKLFFIMCLIEGLYVYVERFITVEYARWVVILILTFKALTRI